MKLLTLFIVLCYTLSLISCGKNKSGNPTSKSSYWETKSWDYYDDDADGVPNADELKAGTHPELINAPNMKNFTITNAYFFLKSEAEKLNTSPLRFEVQNSDANLFLYKTLSPLTTSGTTPSESYEFQKEHFTLISSEKFREPHISFMLPKIDSSYLKTLQKYFYSQELESNRFKNAKNIHATFSLNFSTDLNLGPWSRIQGELKIGDKIIPWMWSKGATSQLHWQTEIALAHWHSIMQRNSALELKILEWEVETPMGKRTFNQDNLKTLTPFYVLSSNGLEGGWHNPKYSLPAEQIIRRPTNSQETLPWYFFKLETPEKTHSSFWLKELSEEELEWIKDQRTLNFTHIRSDDDQKYLSLPPYKGIRSLKMNLHSVKYVYPKYVYHVYIPSSSGNSAVNCTSAYPEFNPKNATENIPWINLDRILNSFIINSIPLKELIKTHIYLSFEYNNNKISSVTLHWDENFIWRDFTILGLKHETFFIEFDPVNGPICPNIRESNNRYWPQYKSEEISFEWKF
jgi:hypothetical protein